jgi:hypothetical protein
MPTATLVTRDGTFVAFLGSSHQQEVNANVSITIISPQSKESHQQRQSELKINTTKKSSHQPDIKPTIQTKKKIRISSRQLQGQGNFAATKVVPTVSLREGSVSPMARR